MITILGKNLIFWTGILTGFLFILSFLGCYCNTNCSFVNKLKISEPLRKYHKKMIYLGFFIFLIHASLAILANLGYFL